MALSSPKSIAPSAPGSLSSLRGGVQMIVGEIKRQPMVSLMVLVVLGVIGFFYGWITTFGPGHTYSAFYWLKSTWNPRTGYEHGYIVPFLFVFLVMRRMPQIVAELPRPSVWGLVAVILGALFFVAAVRTFQPRVALAGLPLVVLGSLAWWRGWRTARLLAFPVLLLFFVIPVPGMIQATNGLQLLATETAYHLSKVLGIQASLSGNDIFSIPMDKWKFNIAEGCSGVRSLMALTLVSAVYAHLTQKTLWKKVVLCACSVPLAIISNCLRVTSILVVAEYFSADFAAKTYHEGSGFLFFLIVGLSGLAAVDWLLNGWGRKKVVVRRVPGAGGGQGPGPVVSSTPTA